METVQGWLGENKITAAVWQPKIMEGFRMKRFSWILALIVALSIGFVGCPAGGDDDSGGSSGTTGGSSYVKNPDAYDFTVAFASGGTGSGTTTKTASIKKDGDNSGAIDPGTLTYITGGFRYAYGSGANTNYGNVVLRFRLNLGEFSLADYGKVSFDWEAIAPVFNNNNSVNSNKKLFLYATDDESAITPYVENKDLIVSPIDVTKNWYAGEQPGPSVNGSGVQHVELEIVYDERLEYLDGNVWFAIYTHAEGGTYEITNLKFWAGDVVVAPTVPGTPFPPEPPTIADVPVGFVPLTLNLSSTVAGINSASSPDLPAGSMDLTGGVLTANFTAADQRINFAFTPTQILAIQDRKNNDVYVNINATISSGTGDSFRYHIGDATLAGSWNNTSSLDAFGLNDIAVATAGKGIQLLLGSNPTTTPNHFIFQHRSSDAITIVFNSITIYVAPKATVVEKVMTFTAGDAIGQNATIELVGSTGYKAVTTQGYEWSYVYFEVTFPFKEGSTTERHKLSDYEKIDLKTQVFTATGDDVTGYKPCIVAAYVDVASMPTTVAMPDTDLITTDKSTNHFRGESDNPTPESRTLTIDGATRVAAVDGSTVWIAIRSHASAGFTYAITDIRFY
jgi:hypothetical protein